jgi:hypothetical protein
MTEINQMPGNSRVWIYQADRVLTQDEITEVKTRLHDFIDQWTSHGQKMQASAEIFYGRMVVIAADESQAMASGCGIDKSVHFMKELQSAMGRDFFQRTVILYRSGDQILEAPIHQFWAMRKAGNIDDETPVIDNTVKTLADLRTRWEIPFKDSWHAEMWRR